MYFVYILKSQKRSDKFYVGITINLKRRLSEHSRLSKQSNYRRLYAPWEIETYTVFHDKRLAESFEIYLKSHSGRAFLKKRLLP